jgi:membrane protein required for colicin V production
VNYLDILFILLLIWGGWSGFKSGFIIQLFTTLALFLGLYAGVHFSNFASRIITEDFGSTSEYVPVIAFTLTFLAVGAMVYFAGKAIEKVVRIVQLSLINKLAGLGLGLLKMCFFIGAGVIILESYDERTDIIDHDTKEESLFYYPIKTITTSTIPAFEESTIFLKNTLDKKRESSTDKKSTDDESK